MYIHTYTIQNYSQASSKNFSPIDSSLSTLHVFTATGTIWPSFKNKHLIIKKLGMHKSYILNELSDTNWAI